MTPLNLELAAVFEDVALALLYEKEAWVKVNAYQKAAVTLRELEEGVDTLEGGLTRLPGVGPAIAKKIREYLTDGRFPLMDRLDARLRPATREMLRAGLAPSLVRHVEELELTDLNAVNAAIDAGELRLEALPKRLQPMFSEYLMAHRERWGSGEI